MCRETPTGHDGIVKRAGILGFATLSVALVLAGCTGDPAPNVTVTVTATATPAPAKPVTATASPAPAETETVSPNVYVPLGDYAIVEGDGATRDDAALAAAFVDFALDPSTVPEGLTFAPEGVQLGILQRIFATRTPGELRERSAWDVGTEGDLYFESEGPFSAIEPLRQWVVDRDPEAEFPIATGVFEVAVGRHDGCPYPIDGVPPGMESARQVWLKPVGEDLSCAGRWFGVDLFVVDGAVVGVTIALGSP